MKLNLCFWKSSIIAMKQRVTFIKHARNGIQSQKTFPNERDEEFIGHYNQITYSHILVWPLGWVQLFNVG